MPPVEYHNSCDIGSSNLFCFSKKYLIGDSRFVEAHCFFGAGTCRLKKVCYVETFRFGPAYL